VADTGAVSRENVEVVRGTFEAWNAGDMHALGEPLDPDVILRMPEGWPEPGPYVGREAVMRQWSQQRETWDADFLELIGDFVDAADQVAVRFAWRVAGYGPESNMEFTGVYMVRKGKIRTVQFFRDHAEALEAVGLSE
jgi:ketosteroid isomerase-like protein